MDGDGDGRFETHLLFEGDRAVEQRRDTTGDGAFDLRILLAEDGHPLREEFDTNADGKADVLKHYERDEVVREQLDADYDGRFEQTSLQRAGVRILVETDLDGDGFAEIAVDYEAGRKLRQFEGRRPDGGSLRVIHFDPEERAKASEEDTSGDGAFDTFRYYEVGIQRRSEQDSNADGEVDIWIRYDSDGRIVLREEDRSGDGQVDFRVHFREGLARRVEEQNPQKDCLHLVSWLDKTGAIIAEERDTQNDCRMDTWNYYRGDALSRQGRDSDFDGRADLLLRFDRGQHIRVQEIVGETGRPQKKIFLSASGQEIRQCLDSQSEGRFDLVIFRDGQKLRETWLDSEGDGLTDQRDVYRNGQRVRVEIDSNGDGRPDVQQLLGPSGDIERQDEDSDFDGRWDRSFVGDRPAPLPESSEAPGALEEFDCGAFDAFWQSH